MLFRAAFCRSVMPSRGWRRLVLCLLLTFALLAGGWGREELLRSGGQTSSGATALADADLHALCLGKQQAASSAGVPAAPPDWPAPHECCLACVMGGTALPPAPMPLPGAGLLRTAAWSGWRDGPAAGYGWPEAMSYPLDVQGVLL